MRNAKINYNTNAGYNVVSRYLSGNGLGFDAPGQLIAI